MKVLVFTHMYPSLPHPEYGIFVQQQVRSLRREGVDVDVLSIDVKKSKWLYPWSFIPFWKQVLTHRYDLVHAHYVFAGMVARSQFRFPVIITHHGVEAIWGWQAPLCKFLSHLVDKTIAVTAEVKDSIGLIGTVVIPCGVDFDLFKPLDQRLSREKLGLPKDKKLVLFAGNYRQGLKRFDLAQQAVENLKSGGMEVELVIAYKQPYEDIPFYMNACDALILCSEYEGSPQVVKEAMACNLPVVSVNVGDVANVIGSIDGCQLCERNPVDMAEKLKSVLDLHSRTDARENSRRYELGSIARRIVQVYQEVLDK